MDRWPAEVMWVDESQAQFEDRLIEAMTRPLTGPGSASTPPPLLVSHPPLKWVPAVATEDVLMLRMADDKGSILYYGLLRDGSGFRVMSGYEWMNRRFNGDDLSADVVAAEIDGYHLDYGPVSFPVTDVVAESIRHGRFAAASIFLLYAFHDAGAPNI